MPSPEKSIRGICPLQRDKSVEEKLGLISVRPNLNMGSAELDENELLLDHTVSTYLPKHCSSRTLCEKHERFGKGIFEDNL